MALYYTMIRIALHFPIMKLYVRKCLLPLEGNCGLPRHPNPERIYNPTVPHRGWRDLKAASQWCSWSPSSAFLLAEAVSWEPCLNPLHRPLPPIITTLQWPSPKHPAAPGLTLQHCNQRSSKTAQGRTPQHNEQSPCHCSCVADHHSIIYTCWARLPTPLSRGAILAPASVFSATSTVPSEGWRKTKVGTRGR